MVPHELVLCKLSRLGLPEWLVKWLRSYLTGRNAYVKFRNVLSAFFSIPSGVPQGSIIGPLIFILFVNDLCTLLTSDALMYADDLKISRTIISSLDCELLQRDIYALMNWCALNGMLVNTSKCKVISFTKSRTSLTHDYHMNGTVLDRVDSIRDLGIVIDRKVRFNEHIATVASKAYAMLGFLRRNTKDFNDVDALKTLYCSLVRSVLEYAVQVWGPYHAIHSNRLESIQRKFLSYVFHGALRTDTAAQLGYAERCTRINLDSLSDRRTLLQRLFVFDVLNDRIDCPDIMDQINFLVPARHLRSTQMLHIHRYRTDYGHNNPLAACCRSFNVVSNVFDFNMSKITYKNHLRRLF